MTNAYERKPNVAAFIRNLSALEAADRARLKRHAGESLSGSANVLGLFYRLLPGGMAERDEETYFLLATLFSLADAGGHGDLGALLRRAGDPEREKGIRRRLETLLDADAGQLPFRLRQTVRFLQSKRVPVDWPRLLADLLLWSHPDRLVQRRWSRSFFGLLPDQDREHPTENSKE